VVRFASVPSRAGRCCTVSESKKEVTSGDGGQPCSRATKIQNSNDDDDDEGERSRALRGAQGSTYVTFAT